MDASLQALIQAARKPVVETECPPASTGRMTKKCHSPFDKGCRGAERPRKMQRADSSYTAIHGWAEETLRSHGFAEGPGSDGRQGCGKNG